MEGEETSEEAGVVEEGEGVGGEGGEEVGEGTAMDVHHPRMHSHINHTSNHTPCHHDRHRISHRRTAETVATGFA